MIVKHIQMVYLLMGKRMTKQIYINTYIQTRVGEHTHKAQKSWGLQLKPKVCTSHNLQPIRFFQWKH